MARQRLEAGGAAVSASPISHAGSPADSREFVLPPDVDAGEVAKAIGRSCASAVAHPNGTPPLIVRQNRRARSYAWPSCPSASVGVTTEAAGSSSLP
jgi:hypothetical protein